MRWILFISIVIPGCCAPARAQFPIRFEPATDGGYAIRARTGDLFITPSGDLQLTPRAKMRLVGGLPSPRSSASDRLPGVTNDLRGGDAAKWRTGIPEYGNVRFTSVWRGIDLVYHGDAASLEYDFVVTPGALVRQIVLGFDGDGSVQLGPDGELTVRHAGDEFRFHAPRVRQGGKTIAAGYRLLGGNTVGFRVGAYDHHRPLVIDPVLGYAALFGSKGGDLIQSVAVDRAGNVYVAGTTLSEIPLMNPINPKQGAGNCSPEPGKTFQQCEDVFVAKFDPTGTQLLYSTYLGGDARDFAAGIAVDRAGNAYVTGTTRAVSPFQTSDGQAWVMKLNPSGTALLYNRNIGGDTQANGIAVDSQGNAYVAGTSLTASFPAVNALQPRAPASSLLVTRDGGATWTSLNNNLGSVTVNSLAIDPAVPSTLYAATSAGLYKSVNGGAVWAQVFTTAKVANMLVLDPKTPSTLYLLYAGTGGNGTGIAKSVDAGNTWQVLTGALPAPKLPAPVRQFGGLALDPSNPSTLWLTDVATASPEIYQSLNGGVSWADVHDFPVSFIPGRGDSITGGAIVADPTNPSRVYTCCASQLMPVTPALFRTDDAGKTWVEGGRASITTFTVDPHNGATVYAAGGNGLLRSTDAGQTWTNVALPPVAVSNSSFRGPLIDPSGGIYLLNDSGVLLRSTDNGITWTTSNGPWSDAASGQGVQLLALDPVTPSSTIYVGFPGAGGLEHGFASKIDSSGAIVWSTLIAGSQTDEALAIAVDSGGNAYVAGTTNSLDFALASPFQKVRGKAGGNGFDAFLSKISSDGSKLLYSTYLGGTGDDAANAIAVDAAGNAFLAGSTNLSDFPTANAVQDAPGSRIGSTFLAEFDPTGQKLPFSTYLGGANGYPFLDGAFSIAVDSKGQVWVAGRTGAIDFPLAEPIQPSVGPGVSSYLARLTPSGSGFALSFSTYLGGTNDTIASLATSSTGSIWMAGGVNSPDFLAPAASPVYGSGFLARLDVEPLTTPAPGVPLIRSVYNAASFRLGDVLTPGEIVTLFGAELAAAAGTAAGYPLPKTLQDVSVTVGGVTAPLFYVSPGQINFQVPFETTAGALSIVVKRGSQSGTRAIQVIPFSPGIFTAGGNGQGTPVIVHISDYSVVTPQNPARAGEFVAIYCTGLGVPITPVPSGTAAPPSAMPVAPLVQVVEDSRIFGVAYAGLAPGFAGLYQVNFQVLANETPGTKLLYLSMAGTYSNQVPLYVQ